MKTKTQHTPEKITLDPSNYSSGVSHLLNESGDTIAEIFPCEDHGRDCGRKLATLFAAAPDLLAKAHAAERKLAELVGYEDGNCPELLDLRAAITAADGTDWEAMS